MYVNMYVGNLQISASFPLAWKREKFQMMRSPLLLATKRNPWAPKTQGKLF